MNIERAFASVKSKRKPAPKDRSPVSLVGVHANASRESNPRSPIGKDDSTCENREKKTPGLQTGGISPSYLCPTTFTRLGGLPLARYTEVVLGSGVTGTLTVRGS